jgi:hypothetical protein
MYGRGWWVDHLADQVRRDDRLQQRAAVVYDADRREELLARRAFQ